MIMNTLNAILKESYARLVNFYKHMTSLRSGSTYGVFQQSLNLNLNHYEPGSLNRH